MKWVRQRCQLAPVEHRGDGVLQPLVASEVTRSTPLRPRAVSDRRKASQNAPSSLAAHVHTQDLTLPFGIDPRRHHHADVDDATALPNLLVRPSSHT